jgi:hypothetical protein
MDAGLGLMRGLVCRILPHRGYGGPEAHDGVAMAANEKGAR